ncbi:MAG: ArsR/SmtB family transcription factor [Nitrososphaera sp.]
MPETLLQREVRTRRITTIGPEAAQALNDPVRLRILETLSHRPMSAEELTRALAGTGYKKATTTVRHHLETLKNAGLVEATKLVEVRGAVMKYYSPTMRAFSFDSPSNLDTKFARLIEETSSRVFKILKGIHQDKKFAEGLDPKSGSPCSICKSNHFKEYVALEILNSAVARTTEKKEYTELLATTRDSSKIATSART